MSRIAGAKRKQLASPASGAQSLTRMTESKKKNRKEMAQAYEGGTSETKGKQIPMAPEKNHPAETNETTGRKINITGTLFTLTTGTFT